MRLGIGRMGMGMRGGRGGSCDGDCSTGTWTVGIGRQYGRTIAYGYRRLWCATIHSERLLVEPYYFPVLPTR